MAAEHAELRAAVRDVILIIQKISDNAGDEAQHLKSLVPHSTIVFNFLESAGLHDKKQALHQGLKALIEAVKIKDSSGVEMAIISLKGLMKDVVNEVKIYCADQQHPKSKRNTPLPKRSNTETTKQPATVHIASAPPLHQEIKRVEPEVVRRQPTIVDEPVREKRTYHSDEIRGNEPAPLFLNPELHRTDSTSLDLGENHDQSSQSITGWLRLITYLSALQAEAH